MWMCIPPTMPVSVAAGPCGDSEDTRSWHGPVPISSPLPLWISAAIYKYVSLKADMAVKRQHPWKFQFFQECRLLTFYSDWQSFRDLSFVNLFCIFQKENLFPKLEYNNSRIFFLYPFTGIPPGYSELIDKETGYETLSSFLLEQNFSGRSSS